MSLPPLESFDCDGDSHGVGAKWEKWKRGLDIYLEAANIELPAKKRATLLHMGGLSLQEIYYNIPGAHVSSIDDPTKDVYVIAIEKLDEYFAPKQSKVYERHLFRLMKQESGEKFEKFLIRLRKQADKCGFANKDESIIDQITEKCYSSELRKKILKGGDKMTLEDIIIEANTLESVNRQMDEFTHISACNSSTVNKIDNRRKMFNKSCNRCGSFKHMPQSMECPAMKIKCHKCGITGHFRKYCLTGRLSKRQFSSSNDPTVTKKARRDEKEEIDYVFHIDEDTNINCLVGGVKTSLLIDSGCKCNLLTDVTWRKLKRNKINVLDMDRSPDKTFYAYGSAKPLNILGSFKAHVQVNDKIEVAVFYVIKNGTKDILGKVTSLALGVLRLGVSVNAVESTSHKI